MTWPTAGSRLVYENPWIRVQEDTVTRPDGTDGIYGVVEVRRPAVFVVAVTDD
ncbi:MAG TPA: NUDIX hydrolase, partial [Terrabacter sp.]|nr:NUDIX hydrolase [Terrabacter sp.]